MDRTKAKAFVKKKDLMKNANFEGYIQLNEKDIIDLCTEFSSISQLTVLTDKEVMESRPMYMNREEAIQVVMTLGHRSDKFYKEFAESLIDALIEAGHLTNHLPEGISQQSKTFEEWWEEKKYKGKEWFKYMKEAYEAGQQSINNK